MTHNMVCKHGNSPEEVVKYDKFMASNRDANQPRMNFNAFYSVLLNQLKITHSPQMLNPFSSVAPLEENPPSYAGEKMRPGQEGTYKLHPGARLLLSPPIA
jgi:hypothetical protein